MNTHFRLALAVSLLTAGSVLNLSAAWPIRILPLGDSITDGAGAPGGYRAPLYQLLTNAGYKVDFVGTQTDNGAASLPDPDHEGHSGWRIEQIDSIILDVFAHIADPDIILVLIGTNDYGQGYDTAHATNRLEALIAKMATNRPTAEIIVANLLKRSEPYDTQIQTTFNPFVPGLVARQHALGREVYFDDLRSAVPLADMPDQLHPGQTGYNKMATNWFGVITNMFTPEGSTNAPAISRAYGWAGLTNITVVFSKPLADESVVAGAFAVSGGIVVQAAALDAATKTEVTLTTTRQNPSTLYTVTVNGLWDRTPAHTAIASNSTTSFKSLAGRGVAINVAESTNYTLVYSLEIPNSPNYTNGIVYNQDHRAEVGGFTRIAYYLELQPSGGALDFLWVSMDAFTTNVNLIGVPTAASGAVFQRPVSHMNVASSVASIVCGTNFAGGNIEFWCSNSSPANVAGVANATSTAYDWGDNPSPGRYGCMQVHNHAASQVLFAFNRWGGAGGVADLGVGNRSGNYLDWTFAQNASSYVIKTLQVYVQPTAAPPRILGLHHSAPGEFSILWAAVPGSGYSIYWKTNLDSGPWIKVGDRTALSNSATFIDAHATNGRSFYHISSP
jgi:lysophospholipase L1-like esterase